MKRLLGLHPANHKKYSTHILDRSYPQDLLKNQLVTGAFFLRK